MPTRDILTDPQLDELLASVQQQQGLQTREQAMEWLLRRRIRRGSQGLTGRGRALYEVKGESR